MLKRFVTWRASHNTYRAHMKLHADIIITRKFLTMGNITRNKITLRITKFRLHYDYTFKELIKSAVTLRT